MPRLFPLDKATVENRVITVPSPGNTTPFSALMSGVIPDLSMTAAKAGTQCFPLYLYDDLSSRIDGLEHDDLLLRRNEDGRWQRRSAVSDEALAMFETAYPGEAIAKDDLFYYVYGILHSEEYRERFADNLSKELPRIPAVRGAENFWAFVEAGRRLGRVDKVSDPQADCADERESEVAG